MSQSPSKQVATAMKEQQFEFEGIPVKYYQGGKGKPLVLLHGSGPGASSLGNWTPVLPKLLENFEVFAMDLIGFGHSGRKPQAPYFDFELWVRQARAMLNQVPGSEKVGVIGHSISGSIALHLAKHEDRVGSVVTTGAMGRPFTPVESTKRVWTAPRNREQLHACLSAIIHDPSVITDAYIDVREPVVFAPGYADYFDSMFTGDKQKFADAAVISESQLSQINCPVLLIHGKQDYAFPVATSIELAKHLQHAELMLLDKCSHSVALERTNTLATLALDHFTRTLN